MKDLRRAGVVVLQSDFGAAWRTDATRVLDAVRSHRAGPYEEIGPFASGDELDALRRDLHTASSALGDMVSLVREAAAGQCAVFVPQVGFDTFDTSSRATLAYALSVALGDPTATDSRQVIWDVRSRVRDSTYFSTFSETNLEADFHTDTQYFPAPERSFLLYCMEPARCGGGLSSICDASQVRHDLRVRAPWVYDVLSTRELPFRVPSAFMTSRPGTVQATLATVFADAPLIRYRRDTLAEGLRHFPEYGLPEVHRALDEFERHLAASPHTAEFFMPRDSLVFVDNHRALHARTSFQDPQRHLLRIRLRWEDAVRHVGKGASSCRLVTRDHRSAFAELD